MSKLHELNTGNFLEELEDGDVQILNKRKILLHVFKDKNGNKMKFVGEYSHGLLMFEHGEYVSVRDQVTGKIMSTKWKVDKEYYVNHVVDCYPVALVAIIYDWHEDPPVLKLELNQ